MGCLYGLIFYELLKLVVEVGWNWTRKARTRRKSAEKKVLAHVQYAWINSLAFKASFHTSSGQGGMQTCLNVAPLLFPSYSDDVKMTAAAETNWIASLFFLLREGFLLVFFTRVSPFLFECLLFVLFKIPCKIEKIKLKK